MRNVRKRRKRLERNEYFKSKSIPGLTQELIKEWKEKLTRDRKKHYYTRIWHVLIGNDEEGGN